MASESRERALLLELTDTHEEENSSIDPNKLARHLYVNRDVALRESAFCRGALAMNPRK